MLVISGNNSVAPMPRMKVSISQSRCLSFQVEELARADDIPILSFNLAIEMLVISGAFTAGGMLRGLHGFNLAIEMLVISGHSC